MSPSGSNPQSRSPCFHHRVSSPLIRKLARYHHVVYYLCSLLLPKISVFKHPTTSITSRLYSMLWNLNLVFVVVLETLLCLNFLVFFSLRHITATKITMNTLYVTRLFSPFGIQRFSRVQPSLTLARHVQIPTILLK
jgi:hypothetical protein